MKVSAEMKISFTQIDGEYTQHEMRQTAATEQKCGKSGPKTIGGKMSKTTSIVETGDERWGFLHAVAGQFQFVVCIYAVPTAVGIGNNPK